MAIHSLSRRLFNICQNEYSHSQDFYLTKKIWFLLYDKTNLW